MRPRTDLAQEAWQLWQQDAGETTRLSGVRAATRNLSGIETTLVEILDETGAKELCKPIGKYATLMLDRYFSREPSAFRDSCEALAELIRSMVNVSAEGTTLVVGLGNRDMTPDSIGPQAARQVLATRHLKNVPDLPQGLFSPVAVTEPGVLGTSGLESAEVVEALCQRLQPSLVIAIDALAAAEPERLCRTLQISDTGIVPGSGVGNHRGALDARTLGIPVVAIGVPTVIDAAVFCSGDAGAFSGMMVTPKEIDLRIRETARVIAMGVNLALHPKLPFEEAEVMTFS